MNNFVFSQDPLLYSSTLPQIPQSEMDIKKQLDTVMAQYQALQQKRGEEPPTKQEHKIDHIGELDLLIHDTDPNIIELLQVDEEYIQLNNMIQLAIQGAIMQEVKWKLNEDKEIIGYVNRLKDIIKSAQKEKESEERKNISEINDYIKNYSDMTFNEYKRLKQNSKK